MVEVEIRGIRDIKTLAKITEIAQECGGKVTEIEGPKNNPSTGFCTYYASGDDLSDFGKELFGLKERK